MEVKVSTGRNVRKKDPVIDSQGVFSCIEKEDLSAGEQERVIEHHQKQEQAIEKKKKEKIWSLKAISRRVSQWLHLPKPK
jgi:hypothetical protein